MLWDTGVLDRYHSELKLLLSILENISFCVVLFLTNSLPPTHFLLISGVLNFF